MDFRTAESSAASAADNLDLQKVVETVINMAERKDKQTAARMVLPWENE